MAVRHATVETLEGRRLLSGSRLIGRTLLAFGDRDSENTIVISRDPSDSSKLTVSTNGTVQSYDLARVGRIRVLGGRMADVLALDDVNGPVELRARLVGLGGDDTLTGGARNDVLLGGRGNDLLRGGDGRDNLFGGAGDDSLLGGLGNDVLRGQFGVDTLGGDDGNDFLFGGRGDDELDGNVGDDRIFDTGRGRSSTGDDDDFVIGDTVGDSDLDDTLTPVTGNGTVLNDTTLPGSFLDDTLTGSTLNDTLIGVAGRDTLTGTAFNDPILTGNILTDTLTGGLGNGLTTTPGLGLTNDPTGLNTITPPVGGTFTVSGANGVLGTSTGQYSFGLDNNLLTGPVI